jgi:hypothetical protein
MAMGIDEALNLLKTRDDAFVTRRATAFLLRLCELGQFVG